ncbi:MAG: hypothetical protein KC656_28520, partial [Myxococcales bacterium]|nr:hypothetical protein [Myxococcales bacterium]
MMIGRIWLVIGVLLLVGQEVPLFPRVWLHRGSDVRDALWGELLEAPRPDGSTVPVLLHDGGHGRLVLLLHGNGETAAM